jgi:opacity protein-like surface antigen
MNPGTGNLPISEFLGGQAIMRGKKIVRGVITVLALCWCATAAHAGDNRLFVMGGGSSLFNTNSFTQDYRRWESYYVTGGKGIIGGELPLSENLGFEGAYSFGNNNINITNLTADPNTTTGYGIQVHRVSGNFVYHIPKLISGVRPYLTGGLEYARFSPMASAKEMASTSGFGGTTKVDLASDGRFGFNYGAGFEWKLTRALGLRIDVRDHFTGSPDFKLSTEAGTPGAFPVSGLAQNVEYSAGLVFHFGK